MVLMTIRPTAADVAVANEIASRTGLQTEEAAEVLTWGGDEHILCELAAWGGGSRQGQQDDAFWFPNGMRISNAADAGPNLGLRQRAFGVRIYDDEQWRNSTVPDQ